MGEGPLNLSGKPGDGISPNLGEESYIRVGNEIWRPNTKRSGKLFPTMILEAVPES